MKKEIVGKVSEAEKNEILRLYERKMALQELLPSLNNGLLSESEYEKMFEKIINDLGSTQRLFQKWWDDMSSKHQWKSAVNGSWNIDFTTNEITLVYNS